MTDDQPPADPRCQLSMSTDGGAPSVPCRKTGTHWGTFARRLTWLCDPPCDFTRPRRCSWLRTDVERTLSELPRCLNDGTHSELIPGCGCQEFDDEICETGFEIWECDGPHRFPD